MANSKSSFEVKSLDGTVSFTGRTPQEAEAKRSAYYRMLDDQEAKQDREEVHQSALDRKEAEAKAKAKQEAEAEKPKASYKPHAYRAVYHAKSKRISLEIDVAEEDTLSTTGDSYTWNVRNLKVDDYSVSSFCYKKRGGTGSSGGSRVEIVED